MLYASGPCHLLLTRFLTSDHFPDAPHQTRLSADFLHGNPQLRDHLMKAVDQFSRQMGPLPQKTSKGSHSTSEKEGNSERLGKGWIH